MCPAAESRSLYPRQSGIRGLFFGAPISNNYIAGTAATGIRASGIIPVTTTAHAATSCRLLTVIHGRIGFGVRRKRHAHTIVRQPTVQAPQLIRTGRHHTLQAERRARREHYVHDISAKDGSRRSQYHGIDLTRARFYTVRDNVIVNTPIARSFNANGSRHAYHNVGTSSGVIATPGSLRIPLRQVLTGAAPGRSAPLIQDTPKKISLVRTMSRPRR